MIDSARLTELDLLLSRSASLFPGKLRAFFDGLKAQGFTDQQSLTLTQTFLSSILFVPSAPEFPAPNVPV